MHPVAQSEVRRWALVYAVLKLLVPTKGRNALAVTLYATATLRELMNRLTLWTQFGFIILR